MSNQGIDATLDEQGFRDLLETHIYGQRVASICGDPENFFVHLENHFFIHLDIKSGRLNFGESLDNEESEGSGSVN